MITEFGPAEYVLMLEDISQLQMIFQILKRMVGGRRAL